MTRHQILELITLSQKCEKFDDIITCYENLYRLFPKYLLKFDELTPIEIGFKSIISEKQKKLKKLESLLNYSQGKEDNFNDSTDNLYFNRAVISQGKHLESEILLVSKKVLFIIDNYVLKNLYSSKEIERNVEVFALRIKGDICKYLSFVEKDPSTKKQKLEKSKAYYESAYKYSQEYLQVDNFGYINSVISYAKFLGLFEKNYKIFQGIFTKGTDFYDFNDENKLQFTNLNLQRKDCVIKNEKLREKMHFNKFSYYNRPVFSVIVPIFKVSYWLFDCINSLVNQTFKNIVGTKYYQTSTEKKSYTWKNRNELLFKYDKAKRRNSRKIQWNSAISFWKN